MKKTAILIVVFVILALVGVIFYSSKTDSLSGFTLPSGFTMSVFADQVPGARVMAFDSKGVMLVSEGVKGTIVALPDADGDGKADTVVTVVSGLNNPHGMAFKCSGDLELQSCDLYVAEKNALDVFAYDLVTMKATHKKKLLDLPDGGGHMTRTILFMPSPNDNTLLISTGSSCNVCDETDPHRAAVFAYDIVTATSTSFARGLRNSVFMDIHPVTGDVWATDMGRDGLGDDIPPDEVNILTKDANYGWPICYGQNIHDTDYDKKTYFRNPCMAPLETPSYIDIPAHSAALGLAFIPEEGWSEDYWHNMLVAYHGSWNRSVPTGYKVVRMKLGAQGKPLGEFEDFITGWLLPNGKQIGRPVDVKVFPGGLIYISDDGAGKIYRVTKG